MKKQKSKKIVASAAPAPAIAQPGATVTATVLPPFHESYSPELASWLMAGMWTEPPAGTPPGFAIYENAMRCAVMRR